MLWVKFMRGRKVAGGLQNRRVWLVGDRASPDRVLGWQSRCGGKHGVISKRGIGGRTVNVGMYILDL